MTKRPLCQQIDSETKNAGLDVVLLRSTVGPHESSDGQVVVKLGPLLMRFVRDRGQDWLELGPGDATSQQFYSFQDVQIALGWKTVEDVLTMTDVEPLEAVLQKVAARWCDIERELAGGADSEGWKRVARASSVRTSAFLRRLR